MTERGWGHFLGKVGIIVIRVLIAFPRNNLRRSRKRENGRVPRRRV
jgi:hypothetical protein